MVVGTNEDSTPVVGVLAPDVSASWGKNDEAPSADLGRGLEDGLDGSEDLLTLLPPREDEVEPARSRAGEGCPVDARSCGERICEPGREGAGEGGAGRVE